MTKAPVSGRVFALSALALCACQSAAGVQKPAVLASFDAETMAKVKSVLSEAMGAARVDLGPGDPSKLSTISVLPQKPSRYEGMSPATPTQFDLVMTGDRCFLVRRDTKETYALEGVACRALDR